MTHYSMTITAEDKRTLQAIRTLLDEPKAVHAVLIFSAGISPKKAEELTSYSVAGIKTAIELEALATRLAVGFMFSDYDSAEAAFTTIQAITTDENGRAEIPDNLTIWEPFENMEVGEIQENLQQLKDNFLSMIGK